MRENCILGTEALVFLSGLMDHEGYEVDRSVNSIVKVPVIGTLCRYVPRCAESGTEDIFGSSICSILFITLTGSESMCCAPRRGEH